MDKSLIDTLGRSARTETVRQALRATTSEADAADLLFLELWETKGAPQLSEILRASQIRRGNPELAAKVCAEIELLGVHSPKEN